MSRLTDAEWSRLEWYEKREELGLLVEEDLHGLSYLRLKLKGLVGKNEKTVDNNTKLISKDKQVNMSIEDKDMICRIIEKYIDDETDSHDVKVDIVSYIQRRLVYVIREVK